MLTISQLAAYAGVSVRTVRWYHQSGLLPEPVRDASGYRRYDGQAVIDLVRIATLARSGVPLARIAELLEADEDDFSLAVADIDAELGRTIAELQQRRADLAQLPSAERLCVPTEVAELLDLERSIGVSERTIQMERDAWILLNATYPELSAETRAWQERTVRDPAFQALLLRIDDAYSWDPDDPRLPELAEDLLRVMTSIYPPDAAAAYVAGWADDPSRYRLISSHGTDASPAWARLNALVEQLSIDRGYPTW